ncbi:MAG: TonB family protein [Myxococcales bacterium]|nr:TonB family protein [Myxococcales bacterium]
MATQQATQKILRVGVIQNGRIVEERLIRSRETVTVGQKLTNTFVIASNAFPQTLAVFETKGGKYELNFVEGMTGRVLLGDSVYDLETLKSSGKAKRTSSGWGSELSERARGKITLGDTTLLFQFVNPPPLRVLPQLPANMRGSFLLFLTSVMGLSGGFLASTIFSTVTQVGAVLYLVMMVPPKARTSGLEAFPDRFVQILAPEETPPPEDLPTDVELSEDGEPTEDAPEDSGAQAEAQDDQEAGSATDSRTQDQVREQARERVRQESALAAFYGGGDDAAGPSLGFTTQMTDRRGDEVLANQLALGENAGSGGIVSRSGMGTSSGAEGAVDRGRISGGTGSRVAEGATTTRTEERSTVTVTARIRTGSEASTGTGRLDENSLRATLRRKQRDIQRCYERALAGNPELGGRVLLQFTIGAEGRVTDARLVENGLNEAVGTCITGAVRRWRFDEPQGGSVTTRVPYILEPSTT